MYTSLGRLFFAVDALFIAASAGLTASAVNRFVGAWLDAPGPATPLAIALAGPVPTAVPIGRDFGDATHRNIFAARRETLTDVAGEHASAEVDATGEPLPTSLRARLVGTSVFDPANWSLATVVDLATQTGALYSVNACAGDAERAPCNELLDQARIIAIEVERVIIFNRTSGRTEYLELGGEPLAAPPVVATAAPAAVSGVAAGIRQTSSNAYEVAGDALDRALSDLPSTSPPRLSPQIEGGQTTGFKLFSIRPDSLYAKIGLQNGDLLKRVNGYTLSSANDALELVGRLKQTEQVTIDLVRRGQPTSIDYRIVR